MNGLSAFPKNLLVFAWTVPSRFWTALDQPLADRFPDQSCLDFPLNNLFTCSNPRFFGSAQESSLPKRLYLY